MKALVTGAAGQDGHYLLTQLYERGYETHALYRGQDEVRFDRLKQEHPYTTWHRGDITDAGSVASTIQAAKPDAIFNMAALSFVGSSWQMPSIYMETNVNGFINVLEAARQYVPEAHIVQASSSEMYGNAEESHYADENSPMVPASPYGVSKLAAHRLCKVYRDSYGMRVSAAISFNHESPYRAPVFVTRKIAQWAASWKGISQGTRLELGNLDAQRDWGFARDFTRGFILMAEQEKANDYVLATGKSHSIREFLGLAASITSAPLDSVTSNSLNYSRPNELHVLCGNATAASANLGWQPSISFEQLVWNMVEAEMREAVPV